MCFLPANAQYPRLSLWAGPHAYRPSGDSSRGFLVRSLAVVSTRTRLSHMGLPFRVLFSAVMIQMRSYWTSVLLVLESRPLVSGSLFLCLLLRFNSFTGGVFEKVIMRNTRIPFRQSRIFSTASDNQRSVTVSPATTCYH